ncbi:uncharacterized protein LOC116306923 [Actinia tenebrosa]|uniref:Uncharacterized protein LOC116306923 n=1 Tax=Actinia tenebrosa TaxID=6105 RepID=A0A6P8J6J1_ACTTE|nr:uncharacterized protein LOC116306923 [Actinia tenebrosa]
MKEKMESEEEKNANENEAKIEEPQGNLLWRISGGVYNKAATVAGGVGWIAGSAISTTCSAVSTVGGYAITPFRKEPKHKSD